MGGTTDYPEEQETPYPGQSIRAKWLMDGAKTLDDAAQRLEDYAVYLRGLHAQGWGLTGPVDDDYGYLRSPSGDAGDAVNSDEDDAPDTDNTAMN